MAAVRRVLKRHVFAACLIGVMSAAVPARADVIAQSPQGFVSRNAVLVAASPAQVWKRLITPSVWWSSDHTFSGDAANMSLDPVAGGCFCEKLPGEPVKNPKTGALVRGPASGGVEHMRVVNVERNKALRMVGALGPLQSEAVNATLTITLKQIDGGTRIVFEYVVGGYMRYPAEKIQPAVDTVMGNQLLGLARGFAPGNDAAASDKPEAAQQGTAPADAPQGAAEGAPMGQGLDKNGLLLPRGRIWSLPPSDGPAPASAPAALPPAPAEPAATPLQAAAIPPDVTPSGGAKVAPKGKRAAAHKPVHPIPASAPAAADDAPLVDVPPPAARQTETPPAAPTPAKKAGKGAHKTPAKPVTPPKPDEPSTDAVNSAFDSALGDPQHPVTTTPN